MEANLVSLIQNAVKIESKVVSAYFKITARIETKNGSGSRDLSDYQHRMLNRIVNSSSTYLSNQSYALYADYCFKESMRIGKFEYNMILLDNSHIYLHNETTNEFRRIHYTMELNGSRDRECKGSNNNINHRWATDNLDY